MWNVIPRRRKNRGVILAYHRVADLERDPQLLAVSPRHFAEQVRIIADEGVALSLSDMVTLAGRDALPPRATCVTFDDGYRDFLDEALPALHAVGVPATLFAATSTLKSDREFWWDELERHCLGPGRLPERLHLDIGVHAVSCDLTGDACWTVADADRYAAWRVTQRQVPTARHRLYLEFCAVLKQVDGDRREDVLQRLASVAGADRTARASHLPLRTEGVVAIANAEGIDIGSHTQSHPSLAYLPADAQYSEIAAARTHLESVITRPVTSFAYPFGGDLDVSSRSLDAVRAAGVLIACTTRPGSVDAATNPHAVPRVVARDWPGAEFRRHWTRWVSA